MSRKPNTHDRRSAIVDALLIVIATHGYEKATIQAIAEVAGLAPGLIHYHFKNKQEILIALIDVLTRTIQQRYEQRLTSAHTPEGRLRAYLDARLAPGADANPAAVAAWVVVGAEALRQPEVKAAYQAAIEAELHLLQNLLVAYLPSASSKAKVITAAATLLAFMEGAFQLSSAAPETMPKGYAAQAAMSIADSFCA